MNVGLTKIIMAVSNRDVNLAGDEAAAGEVEYVRYTDAGVYGETNGGCQ